MTAAVWDWDERSRARLGRFLASHDLCGEQVSTRPVGDGHSNLTYLVGDGDRQVVVRRPPPPPNPAGAHDVLREARILGVLVETPVPVPRVLATARAGEVLDVPLYAMEYIDGPVVTAVTPSPLDNPTDRREVGESLVTALADLHAVDWELLGGRPAGSNQRLVARLSGLLPSPPSPGFERLARWLTLNAPVESRASLVHNDFRIGNVVLGQGSPGRVAAVLDWELTSVGDPLLDLGFVLACLPEGDELTATQSLSVALREPGYPSREEVIALYGDLVGLALPDLRWYEAMAHWKLAALFEYQREKATDPYYDDPSLVGGLVLAGCRAAGLTTEG